MHHWIQWQKSRDVRRRRIGGNRSTCDDASLLNIWNSLHCWLAENQPSVKWNAIFLRTIYYRNDICLGETSLFYAISFGILVKKKPNFQYSKITLKNISSVGTIYGQRGALKTLFGCSDLLRRFVSSLRTHYEEAKRWPSKESTERRRRF